MPIDFGPPDPVIIASAEGFANESIFHITARVIEDEGLHLHEHKKAWHNFSNFIKRLESDEKPGATVRLTWNGQSVDTVSNQEGYIQYMGEHGLEFTNSREHWFEVSMELMKGDSVEFQQTTKILKPAEDAPFGIISDMDDTVIETGVASALKWKLMINSMFKDSADRLPLDGAQEFYSALRKGPGGHEECPFFYLSNSPWNIHDYLEGFLKFQKFPDGVLLLRDIGMPKLKKMPHTELNKYLKATEIIQTYPNMKFILIGDAAELDTDIYLSLAQAYSEQIEAIYIRAVRKPKRIRRVKNLIERHTDINILLMEDSDQAMDHAREHGFIS